MRWHRCFAIALLMMSAGPMQAQMAVYRWVDAAMFAGAPVRPDLSDLTYTRNIQIMFGSEQSA